MILLTVLLKLSMRPSKKTGAPPPERDEQGTLAQRTLFIREAEQKARRLAR